MKKKIPSKKEGGPIWPADRVERRKVKDLVPYARNSRTHSEEQIGQIAASITEWGFTNPVLIAEDKTIIAGHGRVMAAKLIGLAEVPVMVATGWTEAQKRAYVIADNKLTLNGGWDDSVLRAEFAEIEGLNFDLAKLGFNPTELAAVRDVRPTGLTDPDEAPEPPANPAAIRGDLWALGRHRILCGDSLDIEQVSRLTAGVIPDIANCDPPYGISIVSGSSTDGGAKPFGKGSIGGWQHKPGNELGAKGKAIIQPGIYAPIIGDDSTETAIKSYEVLVGLGVPVMALWGGNYYANALPPSRCWLVWDKENTGSFADAELAWTNQDAIVRLLRHQWSGLIKASERGERRVHPTQKPVVLAEWVIETLAPEAKTAIDLFLGSGSTLIACERKGIACYGIEMAEPYVDVIINRWQNFTGEKATLDGITFDQVKAERHQQAA